MTQDKLSALEQKIAALTEKFETLQVASPERWKEEARAAGYKVRAFMDKVEQTGEENFDEVVTYVKQKPIHSLAVAFLAGIVLGHLFGRK